MQVLKKSIKCSSREEYHQLHLHIINPLLPNKLTDKEILILSSFMSIDEKLVEDDRFNSLVRKKVMEKHKLSAGGLSNHLKSMITKGFLTRSKVTSRIKIKPFVKPGDNMQGYKFRIGYAIKQVHTGENEKKALKDGPITVERKSPIDGEITDAQIKINNKLIEDSKVEDVHNNFDEIEEVEDDVPHRMED